MYVIFFMKDVNINSDNKVSVLNWRLPFNAIQCLVRRRDGNKRAIILLMLIVALGDRIILTGKKWVINCSIQGHLCDIYDLLLLGVVVAVKYHRAMLIFINIVLLYFAAAKVKKHFFAFVFHQDHLHSSAVILLSDWSFLLVISPFSTEFMYTLTLRKTKSYSDCTYSFTKWITISRTPAQVLWFWHRYLLINSRLKYGIVQKSRQQWSDEVMFILKNPTFTAARVLITFF